MASLDPVKDDEVQDEIANKTVDWFEQLKSLKEVKIR